MRRDFALAARTLLRSPAFTLVAVLTLALGIGANTAIFSIVSALLLRPPAHVVEPERIVTLWTSDFSGPPYGSSSYPDFETFSEQSDIMAGVAAFSIMPGNLVVPEETVRLAVERVSTNYFDVLGVRGSCKADCCAPTMPMSPQARSWSSATLCGAAGSAATPP